MISVLLAACLSMPSFDMSGPACAPARQEVECGCSECIRLTMAPWTRVIHPRWVEVSRLDVADGTRQTMGRLTEWYFDPTEPGPGVAGVADYVYVVPDLWCPAKHDASMPTEGRLYEYSARACDPDGCGVWSHLANPRVVTRYRAAPYLVLP